MIIIQQEIVYSRGCFYRIRRWIKGWVNVPDGKFMFGLTGKETYVEKNVIIPQRTFFIHQETNDRS